MNKSINERVILHIFLQDNESLSTIIRIRAGHHLQRIFDDAWPRWRAAWIELHSVVEEKRRDERLENVHALPFLRLVSPRNSQQL